MFVIGFAAWLGLLALRLVMDFGDGQQGYSGILVGLTAPLVACTQIDSPTETFSRRRQPRRGDSWSELPPSR